MEGSGGSGSCWGERRQPAGAQTPPDPGELGRGRSHRWCSGSGCRQTAAALRSWRTETNFWTLEPVCPSAAAAPESAVPGGEGGLQRPGGRKPGDRRKISITLEAWIEGLLHLIQTLDISFTSAFYKRKMLFPGLILMLIVLAQLVLASRELVPQQLINPFRILGTTTEPAVLELSGL